MKKGEFAFSQIIINQPCLNNKQLIMNPIIPSDFSKNKNTNAKFPLK